MAQTPPSVVDEVLTYQQDDSPAQLVVDSARWYTWLEMASTFTFRSGEGYFTARKERAGNRRGEPYWRAYRKRGGKLFRIYLGQSGELTLQRLRATAALLAGEPSAAGSLDRQEQIARTGVLSLASSRAHPLHLPTPMTHMLKNRSSFADLPSPLTALIGREWEHAAVCRLLRQSQVRLVTLTGTGGVGKTRLGLQVATALREDFAGGVSFISLAPISEPNLVIPALAEAFDIKDAGAQPLLDLLKASLHNRHLLLVLDNFEQVLPAATQLADLLASCPKLKLLVTSRSRLHVQGEHEFPVPPLAVPDLTRLPALSDLKQVETVHLFVERAQTIKASFALTEGNARTIAEICVRLDGLPLAIELAAARIKLLPPQALLKRLSHRLEVLTGGAQDLPARQRTLRHTFQWSYDLLTEKEQRLFRWLSIFVGSCTLEAAEAVCQAGQEESEASCVLERAASLLDKSLIQQTEREGDVSRIVLLETLREFGWERLTWSGELEAARRAHAGYYLHLAEEAGPELQGPGQAVWLERLEQEHDNLRAALAWALEEVREPAAERRELALRLSAALKPFWIMHGHYREARIFLERVLAACEEERPSLRASALRATADIANRQGDYDRAEALAQQSLALSRELGDPRSVAETLSLLGSVAWIRGKAAEALAFYEEQVRLMRQIGEPGEVAHALFFFADQLSNQGEYARGQGLFEEALLLFRDLGNELWVGATLVRSALYLFWSASADAAAIRLRLQQGQSLISRAGDRSWFAHSLVVAVLLELSERATARAYDLAQQSLALYQEMDDKWYIAALLYLLGQVEMQRKDVSAAHRRYEESLVLAQELGEKWLIPFNLEGMAGVLTTRGQFAWAAQLWGAAEVLRERTAFPLPLVLRPGYERAVARTRAQLGAPAFASAWQEGRAMTPGQALAVVGQATTPAPIPTGSLLTPPAKTAPTLPAGLTPREFEVMRLVVEGMTNPHIAAQLTISLHTVNAHVRSIFNKMGVTSRNALIRLALEQHLV